MTLLRPRKIAEVLNNRKDGNEKYTVNDIGNIIAKLKKSAPDKDTLEDDLNEIVKQGGDVKLTKDPQTGFVDVIWLQTKSMIEQVAREKPLVFQQDTTFSTNLEGCKLLIPVYNSTVTDIIHPWCGISEEEGSGKE